MSHVNDLPYKGGSDSENGTSKTAMEAVLEHPQQALCHAGRGGDTEPVRGQSRHTFEVGSLSAA